MLLPLLLPAGARLNVCVGGERVVVSFGRLLGSSFLAPSQTVEKPQVRPARGPGLREPLSPRPPAPQGRWEGEGGRGRGFEGSIVYWSSGWWGGLHLSGLRCRSTSFPGYSFVAVKKRDCLLGVLFVCF